MTKKSLLILLIITWIIYAASSVFAQTPAIDNGILWLSSNQNEDGSWGGTATSLSLPYPSTSEVINSIYLINNTLPAYSSGLQWLNNQEVSQTDYLSKRIIILSQEGIDVTQDISTLVTYQNSSGGWGDEKELFNKNNILDTGLALQALKAINYPDLDTISYALNYLITNQNDDGGWAFSPDSDSNVYMTAMVSRVLNVFSSTFNVKSSIDSAVAYLLSKRNPDGAISTDASTIFETAIALDALITSNADLSTVAQPAIDYLINNQLPNGSWNDDPYSTALAIRALSNVKPNLTISSEDITFSDPAPTVGDTITITATIHNEGPAIAENVLVQFYDSDPDNGGELIDETTTSSIPAYGKKLSKLNFDNFLRNKGLFIKQRWHLKLVVSAFLGATSLIL